MSDQTIPAQLKDPDQGRSLEPIVTYERSPVDVLRVVLLVVVLGLGVLLDLAATGTIAGIELDLVRLFERLPTGIEIAFVVLVQLVAFIVQTVLLGWQLWRRQWRTLATAVLAIALSAGIYSLVDDTLNRPAPPGLADVDLPGPVLEGETWPSGASLAGWAAFIVVLNSKLTKKWRRAQWLLLASMAFLRVVTATSFPLDIVVSLAIGGLAGTGALLLAGRPSRRPSDGAVAEALDRLRLDIVEVHPAAVDARGSKPYFAQRDDGSRVFAKVLGTQERYADILFRTYRRIRYPGLADERAFSSLRRAVEHEAMLSLMARDVAVRTPRFLGLAGFTGLDALVLTYEGIAGKSLDSIPNERLTDSVLTQTWTLVHRLHAHGIAHRDLRLANVFLDDDERVWLIDFGFGEAAAESDLIGQDVAELLTATACAVGIERAVGAAHQVLSDAELAAAMPRLQKATLSTATRTAAKSLDGGVDAIRHEVSRVSGQDEPELATVERVSPKTIFTLAVIGIAVYVLIPQLTDLPGLVRSLRDVNWFWVGPVIVASLLTYAGAALGLASCVLPRVPYLPALGVSLAGSFVNRLAPVKVAGAALNIRFLQKRGVTPLTAVAGAGVIAAVGLVAHLSITLFTLLAAGRGADDLPFTLPRGSVILLAVTAVLVVIGLAIGIPKTRQLLAQYVLPALKSTGTSLRELASRPTKVVGLVFGGALIPISYSLCLYWSVEAFGGGLSLVTVAVVFLTLGTIASAAPTPGGVGAVEAALIGGLTAAGLPAEQALPAVFLYRLATFWVPVLPGWGAFSILQRREYV
jgi:undecaprenyl-diphosphatase